MKEKCFEESLAEFTPKHETGEKLEGETNYIFPRPWEDWIEVTRVGAEGAQQGEKDVNFWELGGRTEST